MEKEDQKLLEAVAEHLINKETLIGVFVGGSTLGLWKYAPDKFAVITGALVGLWSIYKIYQNKKKELRNAIKAAKAKGEI